MTIQICWIINTNNFLPDFLFFVKLTLRCLFSWFWYWYLVLTCWYWIGRANLGCDLPHCIYVEIIILTYLKNFLLTVLFLLSYADSRKRALTTKGCDIFCSCGLETGSFAALNMAGAEGGSGEWVKTLSLSFPAGCSAAVRYTSLQLTHVLRRSVSHTLDSSVDWPWLIASWTFALKRRNLDDTFVWICTSSRAHDLCACASCPGRCCLDPQRGLRWRLVRWLSVTIEDTPVKDTAPLQQIIRLGPFIKMPPGSVIWYLHSICMCFGGQPFRGVRILRKGTSRCFFEVTQWRSKGRRGRRMLTWRQVVSQNIYMLQKQVTDFSTSTPAVVFLFVQVVEVNEICCFGHLNVAWLVHTAARWWPCMQYLDQNH